MDKNGIAVSLLSISTAEFWFGDDALASPPLPRESNEYAAGMVQSYPGALRLVRDVADARR